MHPTPELASYAITLTLEQHLRAADVGYRRRCVRLKDGYGDRHRNGSMWEGDIEGACAELAAALYLDVPWTGEEVFGRAARAKVPDIGTRTEVRWTAPVGDTALWLDATKDELDRLYVLVTGWAPDFVIVGGIDGTRGTQVGRLVVFPEREVYRVGLEELTPLERRGSAAA